MKPEIKKNEQNILIDNLPLYIYYGNRTYLKSGEINIHTTDCGYMFEASSSEPTTLVFPCGNRRIIVGDNYDFVDTRAVLQYYSPGPTKLLDREQAEEIYNSMFHLIGEEVLSISVFGEAKISFFTHSYEQYASITGIPDGSKIVFHLDIAPDYKINIQRQQPKRRNIEYVDCLDMPDLQAAIYHGAKLVIKDTNIEQFIDKIHEIQTIFTEEELYSVITGSAARSLNGIPCIMHDCDFMFKSESAMVYASEILKQYGWKAIERSDKNILMALEGEPLVIDLSYDNYRLLKFPFYVTNSHGLRFLNQEGLLWLALLNRQEFDRTPYKNAYPRNDQALFELTLNAERLGLTCNNKVGKELQKFVVYTDECKRITDILADLPMLFKDTRINQPFKVNCFGVDNSRIFAIINTGTVADMRLVTDMIPDKATWQDVSGITRTATIEKHDNFSLIFLSSVGLPGILQCTGQNNESNPSSTKTS